MCPSLFGGGFVLYCLHSGAQADGAAPLWTIDGHYGQIKKSQWQTYWLLKLLPGDDTCHFCASHYPKQVTWPLLISARHLGGALQASTHDITSSGNFTLRLLSLIMVTLRPPLVMCQPLWQVLDLCFLTEFST